MRKISLVIIMGIIALALVLPATAAGQEGNGKMLQNQAGSVLGSGCQNSDCLQEDCPRNQTPPRDGTGIQHGNNKNSITG